MAFTNQRRSSVGNGWITKADWTFTQAAASDTITVEGPTDAVLLSSLDTTGAKMMHHPRYSESLSGLVNTVTIYAQEGVTTGRVVIFHGS